jgi:hypothetical protein
MGSGGFGDNGSVHWKIVHTADEQHGGYVKGRDPNIRVGDPDFNKATAHRSPEAYLVRLKFPQGKGAATLRDAAGRVYVENGYDVAEIRVPGITRSRPPEDDDYEIIVRW